VCGAARAISRIAARDMLSEDPQFEEKAADGIGLYLNPPQHAVVLAADEKTAIQALDRLDPVLPLSPGRVERHGFEYYRHGTLSLYAALNTKTGEIIGQTVPRHRSAAFVEFLSDLVATQPARREIHVIVDNRSAHKTKSVQGFLKAHPRVHLHFTPTYASWLNQVELWFGKIERDLLARGIFTSIPDLARKIRRYITRYNEDPKPIRWTYSNPAHRITLDSADTVPHVDVERDEAGRIIARAQPVDLAHDANDHHVGLKGGDDRAGADGWDISPFRWLTNRNDKNLQSPALLS
jgi:transposase